MKKVLIGCGIAALCALVLVIILAVTYGPRMARWGGEVLDKAKDEIGREQARQQALTAWAPPAPDTPAEGIFPARVGTATRTTLQDGALLSALGISHPARQATYTASGAEIEVWAFPVNDLEKEGLLAQIRAAHERSGGTKTSVTLPSRSSFSSGTLGINHVLAPKGWLFVFRPRSDADAFEFMDAFFRGGAGAN